MVATAELKQEVFDVWDHLGHDYIDAETIRSRISEYGISELEVINPSTGFYPIHYAAFYGKSGPSMVPRIR